MPSSDILDLDEIGRAAGGPDPSLDLDAIGRASPADDIIQREQQKFALWQQKNLAAIEGSRAGALADVIGKVVEPPVEAAAAFPANLINLPSYITGSHPLVAPGQPIVHVPIEAEDIRRAIVQNPYLSGSILGANPELTAGVTRGGLDVAESFTTPENVMLLGALPKAAPSVQAPVSAAFAAQMGLDVPEAAARLGEATVTQPTMEQIRQATALGVNIALPTQMTLHPEVAGRRASDAEAIRLEGTRLADYFAQQREQERAAQQTAIEERLLGSDPFRRIAAETARQQGIPVGTVPTKLEQDIQTYNVLQQQFRELGKTKGFDSPEFQAVFQQIEDLKNQYGGNVPGRAAPPQPTEVPNAVQIESPGKIPVRETPVGGETVVREVRPAAEEPAGTRPATAPAVAQAGARGGGVAGEAAKIPEPKEGDIVELHGWVGQYAMDENGKPIIKLEGNRFVEVNEPVKLRLTVTQDGKIVWKGELYEPAVGGGKPWRNAYNQATGRLKIRRVDGSGGITYFIGPSSDYIVTRLNALYPPKPLAKPSKVERLSEKETTADAALPGETENVDTPVDEFIFNAGLAKELAENKAARVEVRNNISIDLPEFTLERMRRHPAPQPHSGDIKPARMLYNPSGAHAGYLIFLRGPHYSYRIPLTELPTNSWGKLPGGAWFDKRAILAFLANNERRFANRNTSGENEYFTPQDIDAIRGVTGKVGRPRTHVVESVSLDQPAGEEGTVGNVVTAEPRYISRMSGIIKRTFDNLLKDQPELFNELLDKPAEQLSEEFWGRIRAAIAAQEEFKAITTPEKQAQAIDLMLNELRVRKETPGGFGEQGSLAPKGWEAIEGEPARADQEAANLQEARKLIDDPNNGLSEEARAVLRDILESPVAAYLNGRKIRFRLVDRMERPLAAYYSPAEQLIAVARNRDPFAGAHEFFHPLWEMIQDADRANVKRWRDQAIAKVMETATGKDLADLQKLAAGELGYRQFYDEGIDNKFYNWSSAEEFFAHMLTDRFARDRQGIWGQVKDVLASQDSFLAKIREILAVIFDAIRQRVPGLRTQADALQKQILSGKYDVLPPDGKLREQQAMLKSPEKIEKFVEPLEETETPEKFRAMASVLNKGLINPAAAGRFAALPEGVREELKDLYGGRIATHQEEAGPTFREVMRDQNRTPEERSDYSRYALMEWQGFKADEAKIVGRLATANRKLDELTLKAIEAIPETNEAEVRATNSLGQVLDKIKEEREKTAEGAQVNERIREGIDHLDALNDLLRSPVAMSRALRDISNLVGRRALTEERPGEEVLELISAQSGFEGGVFGTPAEWVRALARHLDRMRNADGSHVIAASEDVIESTLWMLRQRGDWKQELLEARMTEDGTLRRFNAEYLNDLRARVPRGFDAILRTYATAQVEADALRSASNRLNRRIINLEERRNNLQQGVEFINQHSTDAALKAFEKDMQETTGAISGMERTDDGWIVKLKHPLTGNEVRLNLGFEKGESHETLKMMAQLAEAGLEYGNRPDADPLKAAWWRHFEENLHHPLMALNPSFDILKDPLFDPIKEVTKLKYFLLVESNLSKIPGMLPSQTTRALQAFASAVKTEYEIARVFRTRMLNDNLIALRSHTQGLKDNVRTLRQWRDEVAGPIIDSLQHFGQIEYRVGDLIGGWGHVITAEDMKAVKSQYGYDQRLIKLSGGAEKIPAVREFQTMVKEPAVKGRKERSMDVLRLPLSRGPGTTTRYLTDESRALPAQWKLAVERNNVDTFLNHNDNFIKLVLGHVLEDDRDYVMLGKGRFASDYQRIRQVEQELNRSGTMPNNIQDLSQLIASLHNIHLEREEMPATAGDVRRALIEEVTGYMRKMQEDTEKKETSARVGIVSYENEYTQARGGKVAPGTLYRYGIADTIDVIRKGNNALEPYVVRVRDYLKLVENALLEEKRKLLKTLNEVYRSESVGTRMKAAKIITEGSAEGPSLLQRHQMTLEEIKSNIDRVGKLLGNFNDIIRRREEFYGDDIISQIVKPMFDATVGSVLLTPPSWILNKVSGTLGWALKLAEVQRGGWLTAGPRLIKTHVKTFMRAMQRKLVPKTDRERVLKSLMADAMDPVAEQFTGLLADIQDWEQMQRSGVVDAYDYKDAIGSDRERPFMQNFWGALDSLRDIRAEPNLSARAEFFSRLGMMPRAWTTLIRKVGMRQVDNSINVQAIAISNSIADMLRKRAILSFDARLESDPKFRELYEQYGNNFKQFALHLAGEHQSGILLTPAELTGRYNPLNMRKAAVQLRRMFERNNDPVDLVMLKYWWNQRNANGDRNAAFMTPGQRWALQFTLAEDANMATPNTRPTFFMGSRERQMLGVLNQWWLWNTDRLRDLYSKVRGQKTYAVRYLPAVFGFLMATAVASLFGTTAGQKVNEMFYNTLANTPGFWDAETDEERLKILTSISANYWGMIGSFIKMATDTPGKLGYRNPTFFVNMATDLFGMASKIYQSGDYTGPALDFLARYSPAIRAIANRLPGREGLVDLRNAANALKAATPGSMEARVRQPASGSDIRATPMTPLYNALLNAAMAGDWSTADEVFQRAVAQATALGIPNPEQAIASAIRTRAPESAVYSRALTDEERELVYSRLTPAGREAVDKANAAFEELASRYGGGAGGAGGGAGGAIAGSGGLRAGLPRSAALGGITAGLGAGGVGLGGGRVSSLAPRPVRSGFRSRSLTRGRRTRSLLRAGMTRPRVGRRLRRLAV